MKKLWNSIAAVLLVIFCCMSAASHMANKFFQQDIGNMIVGNVDADSPINTLFDYLDFVVPDDKKAAYNELKEQVREDMRDVISQTTQTMMDDIVNGTLSDQNLDKKLNDMIYEREDDLAQILFGTMTKDQIHAALKPMLAHISLQKQYENAIDTARSRMPQSFLNMIRFINLLSKQAVRMIASVLALLCVLFLVITNWRHLKWTFPTGMGTLSAGILLLGAGAIIPVVYTRLLQSMTYTFASLQDMDFQIITYYGMAFTIIGVIALALYQLVARKHA